MVNPKFLVRKVLPAKGILFAEEGYRKGRIYSLQARYGFPAKGLRIIAVTGTNGKTTTCIFINELLKSAGFKTALYSTATIEVGGKSKQNKTHLTLPPTEQLLRFFREAKNSKADFVVLEATSQGLHQHKLFGIPVEIAVMTNLTQDHLDYHQTMNNYAAAKAGVIGMTKTLGKELGRKGFTVNAIAPGFIRTAMTNTMPKEVLTGMEAKVPVARLGETSDIANAVMFLSSEQASYINASVVSVDGGIVL